MSTEKTSTKKKSSLGFADKTLKPSYSSEALAVAPVPGTPFSILRQDGKYQGLLGQHKVGRETETEEDTLKDLERTDWDRIIEVMAIVVEVRVNYEKSTNKKNQLKG